MTDSGTYKAVLFGPNPIASGIETELEFVDGKYQEVVVVESEEDGQTVKRTYRRGHHTTEPISYRFSEEDDSGGEADVPN